MSEFAFLFRGRDTGASVAQMQKTMETWSKWFKELDAQGHLKDKGNPLQAWGKIVSGKNKVVSDGPFAETKDLIGGYVIIDAESLSHAAELAEGCPIYTVGGSVEIRPVEK